MRSIIGNNIVIRNGKTVINFFDNIYDFNKIIYILEEITLIYILFAASYVLLHSSAYNLWIKKKKKSNVSKFVSWWSFSSYFGDNGVQVLGLTFLPCPTSIMVLFEIHQTFKGHFLNELRVSFKVWNMHTVFYVFYEVFERNDIMETTTAHFFQKVRVVK